MSHSTPFRCPHPILSIYNGHVSGREVGSTMDIMGIGLELDEPTHWSNRSASCREFPGCHRAVRRSDCALMRSTKIRLGAVSRLVSIDSVEGRPAPGAPFGPGPAAALREALALAEEWGLTATPCTGTPPAAPPRRAPTCGRRTRCAGAAGQ